MKMKEKIQIAFLLLLPIFIVLLKASMGVNFKSEHPIYTGGKKAVGVVTIEGTIFSSKEAVKRIETLSNDKNIVAILLDINSPGGAVAPSQEIFEASLKARNKGKKVVASMGSIAASGGYYIAAAADRIFASSGTLTGSIGVIMQLPAYGELMGKLGVDMRTITSGKLKGAGNPYKSLSKEEKRYFQTLLDETHEQFISDVARGRKIEIDSIKPFCEGEIFTGTMALNNGLIDEIGGLSSAKEWIRNELSLSKDTEFIREKKPNELMQLLTESKAASLINTADAKLPRAGLFYLTPGFY